ncbi:hypothetical protein O7553_10140 [Solwaraspora sp. WMMA2059]|uniref:hypothetical protein n=1 Tax=Solwaraspora sp. WMMA2059 TaxID=3015160 RepID=UPI00248B4573|nr:MULTISPECIES: hypothetical protein [unclassified Solwaraspora]WBC00260.1 hypothetical protein O7553_10140 [Solwaraspora sp. WMMA2059]WJK37646.1 hypothetical protein O7610_04900 [Solwaraspora sp. WMMA2065]
MYTSRLIVGKSTVTPGTAAKLETLARSLAPAAGQIEVAWNPEFLREGTAVADTLTPDRIVVGADSAPPRWSRPPRTPIWPPASRSSTP